MARRAARLDRTALRRFADPLEDGQVGLELGGELVEVHDGRRPELDGDLEVEVCRRLAGNLADLEESAVLHAEQRLVAFQERRRLGPGEPPGRWRGGRHEEGGRLD